MYTAEESDLIQNHPHNSHLTLQTYQGVDHPGIQHSKGTEQALREVMLDIGDWVMRNGVMVRLPLAGDLWTDGVNHIPE